jgi:uncharacterized membrane protein
MIATLLLLPGSATASQLLGITNTPTFTPETPVATTPVTEEPATDTPTPTATEVPTDTPTPTTTEVPPDTPTPTTEGKQPTETAKPKATQELVLLPETGEYPIDPQQGLQWIFAIALLLLIGGIFLRAVEGSQKQE